MNILNNPFLCACVYPDLGVNQRGIAKGITASATIWAGSAICAAAAEVALSGNSGLSAWKRTKDRSYLRSHSHTWDMRWHISFSSAHLHTTTPPLGLWYCDSKHQRLIVLDLGRQWIVMGHHLSALLAYLSYFIVCSCIQSLLDKAIQAFFSSITGPTHHHLIEVCFLASYLCWNIAEKHCFPGECYSVFHHFLIILLFISFFFFLSLSPRDYPWTLSSCSILTVSDS